LSALKEHRHDERPSEPIRAERRAKRARPLVGRIQTLTLELQESRRREHTPAVAAKERMLEQLRWRLADVARRTATDRLGNAA
jgi:hypothetical protein